jgi:hypothetical protein
MIRHPKFLLPAFAAFLLVLGLHEAAAQVRVDISLKRKLYVMYEPLIAAVTVHNLSGRPLLLDNTAEHRWLSFNIESADGRIIPPNNPDYAFPPAAIEPGEKLPAAFNLTPLFPLQEFGLYRIRASVYVPEFGRFFSSPPLAVEITEGRPIWQEVVGVPGGDGKPSLRTITLLSHKLSRSTRLYARIEDRENGRIYATHQLGPFLTFGRPDVILDARNEIHILQNSAPKQFLYTHLDLDGKVIDRQFYVEAGSRPRLAKQDGGTVVVSGGRPYTPGEEEKAQMEADKIGDRPVPLPGS